MKDAKRVLEVFAQYGYRKTSMADIAQAADVSRKWLHKRYGNKEACYAYAINTYLGGMYERIFALLEGKDAPPVETLQRVFDVLIGEAIDITQHAHGTSVLADTLSAVRDSNEDWSLRLHSRLGDYLATHHLASPDDAQGIAFTLIAAGKGILLEKQSRERYHENMTTIIETITSQPIDNTIASTVA